MTGAIHFAMTQTEPGGLREVWNDIAAGLSARGHATRRFALYPYRGAEERAGAVREGWEYVLQERATSPLATPRLFRSMTRYLRETQPRAIVTAAPLCNVLVPLAVRAAGLPTRVYSSHHSPTQTHKRVLDALDSLTGQLPCVRGIISVSNAVAASLDGKPARYRAKRLTIRNALPDRVEAIIDGLFRAGAPAKVPGRIVAMGRLSYQKNFPMLLRAMPHVPQGTLDIVGEGEDEAQLHALVQELGLAERVRFIGRLAREDALSHAATAQIFVQVSRFEGHSLALIEAARLGLPLVVSDVPEQVEGVTDIDGERCGQVVRLDDHAQLGAILSGLLADEAQRKAWAARARKLGLGASNRAMIDAYERLLTA